MNSDSANPHFLFGSVTHCAHLPFTSSSHFSVKLLGAHILFHLGFFFFQNWRSWQTKAEDNYTKPGLQADKTQHIINTKRI